MGQSSNSMAYFPSVQLLEATAGWFVHIDIGTSRKKIQKLVHIWVVSVSFCYCLIPPTKTSYDIGT